MSEQSKLGLMQDILGFEILGITRGDNDASDEEIAKAIRKALIDVRRGNGTDIDLNV